MTVRQSIMTAIGTRLSGILITGGYTTDAGKVVHEWPAHDVEAAECLLYEDPSSKTVEPWEEDDNTSSKHYKRLTVNIYIVTTGASAPGRLRTIIADVYKAIGTDVTWSGYAVDTELEGDDSDIAQEKKKIGGTQITIYIDYVVDRWAD